MNFTGCAGYFFDGKEENISYRGTVRLLGAAVG